MEIGQCFERVFDVRPFGVLFGIAQMWFAGAPKHRCIRRIRVRQRPFSTLVLSSRHTRPTRINRCIADDLVHSLALTQQSKLLRGILESRIEFERMTIRLDSLVLLSGNFEQMAQL